MKYIWSKKNGENTFVEFKLPFNYTGGKATLNISADYRYQAFIDGELVSCGQYADLPDYKSVNTADITDKLVLGKNTVTVIAWHLGQDYSACRTMPASVGFEILVDKVVVASSDENTLCRECTGYRKGEFVTPQLGYGYNYDFTDKEKQWEKAVIVDVNYVEVKRPILDTKIYELCNSKVVAQGVYKFDKFNKNTTSAEKMQNAFLSNLSFAEMTGLSRLTCDSLSSPITFKANKKGIYAIFDMGRETCGYLGFTVSVKNKCKMYLGWGEHLADLRVRTKIGVRNFAFTFNLNKGENKFDDYMFRLGCRYVCIFVESNQITVERMGIREVGYPFNFVKKEFKDSLHKELYELGRRTLYLCAHEHYEDCPWREQALYGMDSRNQMLFGYGAFNEYLFPKANLKLIARSMQSDGLIALTAPARMTITIPSFTAYWLMAIGENLKESFDQDFAKAILPYAEKGLTALLNQKGEKGLNLFTDIAHWNFHEWSDGLDGGEIFRSEEIESKADAGLTALTAIACKNIAFVYEKLGDQNRAGQLKEISLTLQKELDKFYDKDKGVYASYIDKDGKFEGYHVYTQSVILLAGGVNKSIAKTVCEAIKNPVEYNLVPATFSAFQLKYQALIDNDDKNIEYCVKEVEQVFGKMLLEGATSLYETSYGEKDFDDAGSLCHGWSAVVCWVLDKFSAR